jgi:hypothetical protein
VTTIEGRGHHIWVGGQLGLAFFDGNSFRRIAPVGAETFELVKGVEEAPNGSVWLAERRGIIEIEAGEIQKPSATPPIT